MKSDTKTMWKAARTCYCVPATQTNKFHPFPGETEVCWWSVLSVYRGILGIWSSMVSPCHGPCIKVYIGINWSAQKGENRWHGMACWIETWNYYFRPHPGLEVVVFRFLGPAYSKPNECSQAQTIWGGNVILDLKDFHLSVCEINTAAHADRCSTELSLECSLTAWARQNHISLCSIPNWLWIIWKCHCRIH